MWNVSWGVLAVNAFTILLLLIVKVWWSRRHLRELGSKIPGPHTFPLLGNLQLLGGPDHLFSVVRDYWSNHQGEIFRLWIGPYLYCFITKAEDVEILLVKQHLMNRDTYLMNSLKPAFEEGLVTCRAGTWRKQRKVYIPILQAKAVESYVEKFNKKSQVLLEQLKKFADGQTFDIFNLMMMCTGDMICETTLGCLLGFQSSDGEWLAKMVTKILHIVFERIIEPWLYFDFIFNLTKRGRIHRKAMKVLNDYSNSIMKKTLEEHREGKLSDVKYSFPHRFIRASEKEGKPLNKKLFRGEIHTMALAGMDTTAGTNCFILMMLSLQPELQEEVFQEIKEIFRGDWEREITVEDIKQMKRLDRFIKETMRILPVVPIIPREVDQDLKLSTCTIPAGSTAIVMNYFVHRDARYFPNPEHFDPDRFLPEHSKDRHPYSYIPFGAGPRMCVGFKYAEMSVVATIAAVVKRYRLLPAVKYEDLRNLHIGVVFRPACGFKLKMVSRE